MSKDEALSVKDTLKLALEALETLDRVVLGTRRAEEAITAIKEALAQPEQEPVANVVLREGSPTLLRESDIKPTDERLYTTQPVLASDISQERVDETQKQRHDITPPQRTWVGLSVFEINDLVENTEYEDYRDLVERTEAKLKEKNT